MQEQDVVSKEYFQEDARIADFINGYFFQGRQVVSAKDVREADSAVFGRVRWFGRWTAKQRYRDIVRWVLLGIRFAMVGIEEQGVIHFAMPVRAMGYDFLSYDRQVKKIKKRHSILKDLKGKAQFLSGMSSEDLLEPVVTVMSHSEELLRMKDRFRKGSKVDMCKALKEWMDESKLEGRLEGEDRFAGLTDRLLQDGRTEDLRRAASDKVYREQLYREFGL